MLFLLKLNRRRQDNAVLPTNTSIWAGNVLTFPHVTKEHRGTYFCVATNVVGTGARRNVDVEVTFAPLLKVQRYSIYILKKHKILCLT